MTESTRPRRVLVIDDEPSVRNQLAEILRDEGYLVSTAGSGEEGVEQAIESQPDVVFLDVWLPGIDGIETLRLLSERGVSAPVVMISGHGTIETAVRATKLGAYDFIEKPMSLDRVLLVASNALRQARLERRNRALRAELRREAEFLGTSGAVEELRRQLTEATDGAPVLLYGEKGTGRRLAARWLALHGPRADGPFLDVQVSAFPRDRLIRTLFGSPENPARDPGRLILADEGTLYLENGDTLPVVVQSALATGLRDGAFPTPRGRGEVRSEAHVILAILEPPERLVESGAISGELLCEFRHTIAIPSLRERSDDIPDLAGRFVGELCREYAREALTLSPEVIDLLLRYHWPGNVRELKRVCERLVLLSRGPVVTVDEVPALVRGEPTSETGEVSETLRRFEEAWVRRQLEESGWSLERASGRMGITADELKARMSRLGVDLPPEDERER